MVELLLEQPVMLLGLLLTTGYLASLILQRINIPHVVVYILSGFTIANTLLKDVNVVEELEIWFFITETIALGLIGFKVGTELKFSLLSKEPKFITIVLFVEVAMTFVVVFFGVLLIWKNFLLALIIGGLATATAPAATVAVIQKSRAKGPLTTRIQWILAFDDVIAVLMVETIFVYVVVNLGGKVTITKFASELMQDIGIAVVVGLVFGIVLDLIVERLHDDLEMMEFTLAFVILSMGVAHYLETSVILSSMIIGAVATNRKGENYEKVSDLMEILMSPVIMLFFVLVGARVLISDFNPFPWLALFYLIFRTGGKLFGAYAGSTLSKTDDVIRKNLGGGLLAQGGVTLGLVAVANDILVAADDASMGKLILSSVIISTIFSETMGSYGTRFVLDRAGETNKLVTKKRVQHTHGDYEVHEHK